MYSSLSNEKKNNHLHLAVLKEKKKVLLALFINASSVGVI